ncbi:MAG TPA: hypothetical protein PKZ31_11805 [Kaistella chaponensis]|nr:hypothetical protein [Kaistella chaponensis]HPW89779.1 hypothetical protein [Kaistella chaponensis]
MRKTQSFIDANVKWQALGDYVLRIETYRASSPGLVIENCKSLVESIFKTILVETNSKTEADLKDCDIGNLYKQVKKVLFFEEKGYLNIIGSFSSAISKFRNKLGETSHGKDIYTLENNRTALFDDEILFLLSTTDNISYFLLSYYKNLYPAYAEKRKELEYEDNQEFNEWFDDTEETVSLGGVSLSPSRVLFDGDTEAYKTSLSEYLGKNELIEGLRISPNFASTHSLLRELSQNQDFSKEQIRKLFDAFFFNNQINWIATDPDVASFYQSLVQDNEALLTETELAQFKGHYNNSI